MIGTAERRQATVGVGRAADAQNVEQPGAMKKALVATVVAIALNVLATFIGRGSFLHVVLVFSLALWVALPTLLLSGVVMFVARKCDQRGYFLASHTVFLSALVVGSLTLSAFSGRRVGQYDIAQARSYCESFVPALDQYKDEHGAYPASLDRIGRDGDTPHLLRGNVFYQSDGAAFSFSFTDPGRLMAMVKYRSDTRAWHAFD